MSYAQLVKMAEEAAKEVKKGSELQLTELNGIPLFPLDAYGDAVQEIETSKQILASRGVNVDQMDAGNVSLDQTGYYITRKPPVFGLISPDSLAANRYRIQEKQLRPGEAKTKYYEIVTDYRAIQDQASGIIYTKHVKADRIGRDPETQELVFLGSVLISDDEFVRDFRLPLDFKTLQEVAPVLPANVTVEATSGLEI